MNLNVHLDKTVQEANPNVKVEEIYPTFAQLPDEIQKLIIFVFDYDTVFENLDPDSRNQRACDILNLEESYRTKLAEAVEHNYNKEAEPNEELEKIYEGIEDYTRDQEDSLSELETAMDKQVKDISRQLNSQKITLNSDKDDKAFDRFIQMSKNLPDIRDNILNLRKHRKETPNEMKQALLNAIKEREQGEDHALSTAHNGND